ncbi:trypsin-like serine protease [Fusarium sp. NRRL 52700]|nr:trypsin-like serine protease [Fusarium sp. NRRL 52700]
MLMLNLFNIAVLALSSQVLASPVLGDNTLLACDQPPPPQPPIPPPVHPPVPPPPPPVPTEAAANKSTVEIRPRKAPKTGPIPRIHFIPRHQFNNFAGNPVPPHRPPRQRRDISCAGTCKLPDFIKDDRNQLADTVSFESNFFEGRSGGISYATDIIALKGLECHKITKNEMERCDCFLGNDWAILILADRMGERHGYLGVKEFDTKTQMKKPAFSHVGYPTNWPYNRAKPLRQDGITVEKCYYSCDILGDRLVADADGESGASGGPLFRMEDGLAWQYGVASARVGNFCNSSVTVPDRCSFASSLRFISAVAMARQQFP